MSEPVGESELMNSYLRCSEYVYVLVLRLEELSLHDVIHSPLLLGEDFRRLLLPSSGPVIA